MKRFIATLVFLGALALPVAAQESKPLLQVQVTVPGMVDPLTEDDITELLTDSLRDAFRRQGYDGQVEEIHRLDDAKADATLVSLQLIEWERNRTGGVECTFTAAVRPPNGTERSLGMFTAMESGIAISTRWQLAEAFRDSAERAAVEFWRRLSKLDIVPGIPATKS